MRFLSADEIRSNFEEALGAARTTGQLCPEDVGIEYETQQALYAVAAASPNVPNVLIDEARNCLTNQLKGL